MPKKSKKNHYFDEQTEKYVVEYINEKEQYKKDRIFNDHLYKPLLKLSEVLINSGNYPYALDAADPDGSPRSKFKCLQHQAICHILSILNNFNPNNGKAYSYFTVVITFYLINTNKTEYKKVKDEVSMDSDEYNDADERFLYDSEKSTELKDFLHGFSEYLENNLLHYFPNQRDYSIANAFLEIIKRRDNMPDFQKKKIYLYIREQTNCRQPDITAVFNRICLIARRSFDDYYNNGYLNNSKIFKLENTNGKLRTRNIQRENVL